MGIRGEFRSRNEKIQVQNATNFRNQGEKT